MFCTGVLRATRTLAAHCTLKSAARMTRSILGQNVRMERVRNTHSSRSKQEVFTEAYFFQGPKQDKGQEP